MGLFGAQDLCIRVVVQGLGLPSEGSKQSNRRSRSNSINSRNHVHCGTHHSNLGSTSDGVVLKADKACSSAKSGNKSYQSHVSFGSWNSKRAQTYPVSVRGVCRDAIGARESVHVL